jgi:hypothetical protein
LIHQISAAASKSVVHQLKVDKNILLIKIRTRINDYKLGLDKNRMDPSKPQMLFSECLMAHFKKELIKSNKIL